MILVGYAQYFALMTYGDQLTMIRINDGSCVTTDYRSCL